jgi:hypothetical protein
MDLSIQKNVCPQLYRSQHVNVRFTLLLSSKFGAQMLYVYVEFSIGLHDLSQQGNDRQYRLFK